MRARTFVSIATLLASAACSSYPKPQTAAEPAVSSGDAPGLAVWTPGTTGAVGSLGTGTAYFAPERDGYAAAFAVTRDGRLRVVWPESPNDHGVVRAGKTYRANASFTQYGAWMGGVRNAVPYIFVIVSDQRPDLSRFGSGSKWKYQVPLEGAGRFAEDAVQTVASLVLPGADANYAADYAYVEPRLSGQAQMLTMYCGVRNTDARNYAYFRDLWATFDPWDNTLGMISFASAWNFWPGSLFPFSARGTSMAFFADRASRATAAFWGGCPGLTPFTRLQYASAFYRPVTPQTFVSAQPPAAVPSQPLSPTMQAPGTPAPVDDGTGSKPGDKLRVRPSPIFGGPGIEPASGTDGRAERLARMRERMETTREERGRLDGERRLSLRAEQLQQLDAGRLERRFRAFDQAERGLTASGERGTGRMTPAGRAGRFADDGFGGRGRIGMPGGVPGGRSIDRSTVGRSEGVIESGSARTADPGSRTSGAASSSGEQRTGGGESGKKSP